MRIKYEDILWVEALENYVTINTFKDKFTIHYTMKAIEGKLPMSKFKRIHRSYIVNIRHVDVTDFKQMTLTMSDGSLLPIARSMRDAVHEQFGQKRGANA